MKLSNTVVRHGVTASLQTTQRGSRDGCSVPTHAASPAQSRRGHRAQLLLRSTLNLREANLRARTATEPKCGDPARAWVGDLANYSISVMVQCAIRATCRRRLAGAWPSASCITVATETWRIARKDTGCVNILLISYSIMQARLRSK